ncbi:MAG: flippase [candidate division Zixibacteria bacterium]|nr:flippase [candidate division Zixibacteria bacterium]
MNTIQRIFKNLSLMLAANIITYVCSSIFVIICARYLGNVRYGIFGFVISFTSLLGVLGNLGWNTFAVREAAKDLKKTNKLLANIILLRVGVGTFVFLITCILINLLNYPHEKVILVYILAANMFLFTLGSSFRWVFEAYQKFQYESLLKVLSSVLLLGLGIFVVVNGMGLVALALSNLCVSAAVCGIGYFVLLRKLLRPRIRLDFGFCKHLIRETIPFSLNFIFTTIYLNLDVVLLSTIRGDAETGWYSAASKLVIMAKTVINLYIPVIFPVLSKLFVSSLHKFKKLLDRSFIYLLMIGLGMATLTTVFADRIVVLIFGSSFTQSADPLRILIWAAFLVFLNGISGNALVSAGYQKLCTKITGIGLAINISLNLLLIPSLGRIGTSLSILATELVVTVLVLYWQYKILEYRPSSKLVLKILASAIMVVPFAWWLRQANPVLGLSLCVIIYGILLLATGAISKEDKFIIKKLAVRTA